jgi:phosphopantetheine adenylyltransferase
VAHLETMEEIQDFKITRLENEVSFFKATTQESMLENGKRLDRIISILEDDDSINKKGLVSQVKDMEARMYSLNNFLKAYKLAIAMIAGLFTAIGAAIGTYINFKKM